MTEKRNKELEKYLKAVSKELPKIPFRISYIEVSKYNPNAINGALYCKHEKEPFNSMSMEIVFTLNYAKDGTLMSTIGFISDYGYFHNNELPPVNAFVEWIKKSPNYKNLLKYL